MPGLRFMNYGYYKDSFCPDLSVNDEKERYPIHLYHYLCSKVDMKNLNILEVGSGRGGGADYILRTFKPRKVSAIDISITAVNLCKELYTDNNLDFLYGSAEDIPFSNNTFDLILNVESSHCYPNFDNFLREVARVLKPSSYLLITDFRPSSELDSFRTSITSFFDVISEEEITDNILSALDLMSSKRSKQIKTFLPSFLNSISASFAGIKGSELYNSFQNKDLRYFMYVLKTK